MKIIKEGSIKATVMQGRCRVCGCVVEAERAETEVTMTPGSRAIACPTRGCGERIAMSPKPPSEEQITAGIQSYIRTKREAAR